MIFVRKKGQTLIEYVVLTVVILGAFIAASNYIKRGLQGRWKMAVDDIGDQFDPRVTNGHINITLLQNIETTLTAFNTVNGIWTLRTDTTNSLEMRRGTVTVFSY